MTLQTAEECLRHFHQTEKHFAAYFLQYAKRHQQDWNGLTDERFNLLPAVQCYRDAGDYASLLDLREALQPYFDLQGRWDDSLMLNGWTISLAQTRSDWMNVARFTHDRADMLNQMGNYCEAEQSYRSSEESYIQLDQKESALKSRHMRSMVVRAQGRLDEAQALCETTIEGAQALGMSHWLPHPLYVRALLARDHGDFVRAKKWIEEGLRGLDVHEEPAMVAQYHHFLGELALIQGQCADASAHLETSLRLSQEVGILRRVVATQRLLGDLARVEKRFEEADQLYRDALALAIQLGDRPQEARILLSHGQLMASRRRLQEAFNHLQRARALYQMIGDPRGFVGASFLCAWLALKLGRWSMAGRSAWDAIKTAWLSQLIRSNIIAGVLRRSIR